MDPDEFIEDAITAGHRYGLLALNVDQRLVFLIAEAEAMCAIDGIDSFLRRYASDWLSETSAAFEAIGATEIAIGLRSITPTTPDDDPLIDRVNDLINDRAEYDYDSIRRIIVGRLSLRNS